MASFAFVVRIIAAWFLAFLLLQVVWSAIPFVDGGLPWPFALAAMLVIGYFATLAISHVRRVRLIAGPVDAAKLGNRQYRRIEIPFEVGEAFELVDAAIRELPRTEEIESARGSLQVRAKVWRFDPYGGNRPAHEGRFSEYGLKRNQILATVTPGDGSSSLALICEPEAGAWSDWLLVDHGTNLENAEAITRAITRRVAERRRGEQADVRRTVTDKEQTVARLNLLHAQVEPHFLYNTLASAQLLTRSDPARADEMLGHLIGYLRSSLPLNAEAWSTLGVELERARAYLEIMKIRMGPRLTLNIDVPEALQAVPLPGMMLQTLVENAIKHGLEPQTAGGSIWILARESEAGVAITVADDGRGFHSGNSGTGIGLKNVRERLQLLYGGAAALAVVSNFPSGVAATITVPGLAAARPQEQVRA